jgi:putative transposase
VAQSSREFTTLECELLDRQRFATPAEARLAVFDFIEGWYNPRRRHSALRYESPLRYWDKVHLSSYGQSLAADWLSARLTPYIERVIATRHSEH